MTIRWQARFADSLSAGGLGWGVILIGLFAAVLGGKLFLIRLFGNSVPFWDQWALAEVFSRYLDGTLQFSSLFDFHNEHRILFTRLLAIGLLEFAGNWDPLLEQVVNAQLMTAFVVLLVYLLAPIVPTTDRLALALIAALTFALPIGWENVISGFQSQFPFLLIFATLSIYFLMRSAAFAMGWWIGLLFAVAAYFSTASGALTAAAAAVVCLSQIAVGVRRRDVREGTALGIILLLTGMMLISVLDHGSSETVHTLRGVSRTAIALASFPLTTGVGALIVGAPTLWFCWDTLRTKPGLSERDWFVLGMAAWAVAHLVSIAFGRPGMWPASRYIDTVLFIVPLNCATLLALCSRSPTPPFGLWRWLRSASTGWIFLIAFALMLRAISTFPGAVERGRVLAVAERNTVAFLQSADMIHLADKPHLNIPFPNADALADWLSDPTIRSYLPDSIRPPGADIEGMRAKLVLKGALAKVAAEERKWIIRRAPHQLAFGVALLAAALHFRRRAGNLRPADEGYAAVPESRT